MFCINKTKFRKYIRIWATMLHRCIYLLFTIYYGIKKKYLTSTWKSKIKKFTISCIAHLFEYFNKKKKKIKIHEDKTSNIHIKKRCACSNLQKVIFYWIITTCQNLTGLMMALRPYYNNVLSPIFFLSVFFFITPRRYKNN